jgi:hypothetical protein
VIAFVVAVTPSDVRWPMAIAGTLAGTFMVLRGFASEFHPMNRSGEHRSREAAVHRRRGSGRVRAESRACRGRGRGVANGVLPETRMLPTTAQMLHAPTIILGCVVGGAALALMFYFNFSSVIAIGTENLMAMMAFSPATTWIFQEAGVALGWIDVRRPDADIVAAIVVCIAAVLLIFWADVRARRALALRHLPSTDRIPLS